MLTIAFGHKHQIELYTRILELPAAHYLAYECYRADEADELINPVDRQEHLVAHLAPEARRFLTQGTTPRVLSFMALVASSDGELRTDVSEPALRELSSRLLVAQGFTFEQMEEQLNTLRKSFHDRLTELFLTPTGTEGDEIAQFERARRRLVLTCDMMLEQDTLVPLATQADVNEAEIDFLQPDTFAQETSALVARGIRERAFTQLCNILRANGNESPERLPLYEFRQRLEQIRHQLPIA
jgi:hypothetical protein